MEILSPAGSPEGLIASIKGGCDAVYLGGSAFGARAFSKNFSDSEIEGAVNYAHDRKVKVYVTVNTLIKDSEMDNAVSFVRFLDDIGADAVLIQDLGLLRQINKFDIQKHASTQMGIHSASGLDWCRENGLDRAVLARELTFDELSSIVGGSEIETEVFVQGAMCYSISGGCLFSSIAGGRSGNRGQCAQPCRKSYQFNEKEGFFLSNADLYGVDWLEKLKGIGVSAVKIEGRMRSHAYAYLSTKVYSMTNKGCPADEIKETADLLKTVFNRGFCEGYFPGVSSLVQPNYADNRGYLLGSVTISDRKFDLSGLKEKVNVRDGISIFRGKDKIGGFNISSTVKATVPFKIEDGRYDIYRTYDPRIDEIKNLIGEVPELKGKTKRLPYKHDLRKVTREPKDPELSFYVSSLKVLDAIVGYADRVYYDLNDSVETAEKICTKNDVDFVVNLPRFRPLMDLDVSNKNIMVSTADQLHRYSGKKMYGSYHMNMFNSDFPQLTHQITLSAELSKPEIERIAEHYSRRIEVMVFGRTELMCTRDPGLSAGMLKDELEHEFPVYRDNFGLAHILKSSDLLLLPYLNELGSMGVDSVGIDLRKRPASLAKIVADAYRNKDVSKKGRITEMCGSINYGHYLRGVS
ncbi:MAG: U32 family peptidase [Candidatus Methanoplasma sp.]|jgi:putative protease|nr:U32 family peptidase [Candidatus Methanoplasma sp.]